MAAKMVIRDVARVLDVPYADADKLAKMIPKKSIFKRPSSSNVVIINCVEIFPSLTYKGTYVSTGSFVITIPASMC